MASAARSPEARHARERQIVAVARRIATGESWDSVTTRRLSTEMGFTQPVLYSHFASMGAVMAAAAVEGFRELADAMRRSSGSAPLLEQRARVYLDFAAREPALYEVMFSRAVGLRFAQLDTPEPLRESFGLIAALMAGDETRAELLWATLHGIAELERTGRLRADAREARIAALVAAYGAA